ncbi:hypothetical protein ACJ64_15445 [Bacillus safensis]|nr:hypothetical protein ACJ64_15445 [Bacillus safensis]
MLDETQTRVNNFCRTIGNPPNIPGTPPIFPITPSIEDMSRCIGRWTRIWFKGQSGFIWAYVTSVGLDLVTNGQPIFWGCNNGNLRWAYLSSIESYTVH